MDNASKKIMISREDSESFCKVMTLVLSFLDFFGFFPCFLVENLFELNDQAKSQAGGGQRMLHNVRLLEF